MEWLDFVDYKEEPTYEEGRSSPEKESERKRKHNQSKSKFLFDLNKTIDANLSRKSKKTIY